MTGRVAYIILLVALSGSRLAAQQEQSPNPHAVQPERPTVATHAGTVATGWFEIETGVERDQFSPGVGVGTPTTLKLGIGSHQQLSIWGSVPQPDSSSFGAGDLSIGVKWRLLDDAKIIGDFAILPSVKLPTGSVSAGRGTGTTDGTLLLISSHDFSGIAMDINAGYTRRSGNGSQAPINATLWTVSFGGPAVNQFGWVAETYGFPATTGPAGQASIVAFLAGPTYQPKEWLALDAGVIIPITGPQPHALYAGGVWNVGKVW